MIVKENQKENLRKLSDFTHDGKLKFYMPYIVDQGEALEEDRRNAIYYLGIIPAMDELFKTEHQKITEEVLNGNKKIVVLGYTVPVKSKNGEALFPSELLVYPGDKIQVSTEFIYDEMDPLELYGIDLKAFTPVDINSGTNCLTEYKAEFDIISNNKPANHVTLHVDGSMDDLLHFPFAN